MFFIWVKKLPFLFFFHQRFAVFKKNKPRSQYWNSRHKSMGILKICITCSVQKAKYQDILPFWSYQSRGRLSLPPWSIWYSCRARASLRLPLHVRAGNIAWQEVESEESGSKEGRKDEVVKWSHPIDDPISSIRWHLETSQCFVVHLILSLNFLGRFIISILPYWCLADIPSVYLADICANKKPAWRDLRSAGEK